MLTSKQLDRLIENSLDSQPYQIRSYIGGSDRNNILRLRKIVFGDVDKEKLIPEFWDWEFKNNYAGFAEIAVAEENNEIIGHLALCPSNILVNGNIRRGSIGVDSMTLPDNDYPFMFAMLQRYVFNESAVHNIDFTYGFAFRDGILQFSKLMGWDSPMELPILVHPLKFSPMLNKYIHNKTLCNMLSLIPNVCFSIVDGLCSTRGRRYRMEESNGFEKSVALDDFIEATRNQHKVMQYRNYTFLDWRYNQNKFRHYAVFTVYDIADKIQGYIVLRNADIFEMLCTIIIDIQVLDFQRDVIDLLLVKAIEFAKSSDSTLVGCMVTTGEYYTQMMKKLFVPSPYHFNFILHKNREISYESIIMEPKNWFLTWADMDTL